MARSRPAPSARSCDSLLPRDYYVSEDIFRQELERVFLRQWTFLGHISELPAIAGLSHMVE